MSAEEFAYINSGEEGSKRVNHCTNQENFLVPAAGIQTNLVIHHWKIPDRRRLVVFPFWLPAYLKAQYGLVDQSVMIPLALLYTMAMVGSVGRVATDLFYP